MAVGATKPPRVSVVVVNWNQEGLTAECLRSLARLDYPDRQIILVDNGSRAGSLDQIEADFPNVTLIRHEQNLGFTGGNNAGIRRALAEGPEYVMLLNNDAEVAPDMLRRLVDFAESDARIGIVGPLICYYDEPRRVWSAGGLIDPYTGNSTSMGEGEVDDGHFAPREVEYVSGCALLVKRAAIEQIGLLDDRFFMYYEETDWCARAREAGYQCWLVPESKVWHKVSLQARAASPRYVYLMTRNRLLYLQKRGASWRQLLWVIVNGELRTLLSWTFRLRHRDKRPVRIYRLRGVLDFVRGRFGEPPFSCI